MLGERIIDTKIDQPQTEIVIDRDKAAAMGVSLQQVGSDISGMMGGNYVNRFNIDGRSYKVIPQATRTSRMTIDQLGDIHVTGPNGTLVPLSSLASARSSTCACSRSSSRSWPTSTKGSACRYER